MKRLLLVLPLLLVLAAARAQDDATKKTPDAPEVTKETKKDARLPDPSKAAPVGDVLAAGTVDRKNLYPLEDGRSWRYEVKTWLSTVAPEEGQPEEVEPPRTHKMDVTVGEPIKIDGKDARCLESRLDEAPAQKAYFFEETGSVLCAKRVLVSGGAEQPHEFAIAPAQPVLQGDLTVGSSWTWSGKVGPSKGQQRFEVLREERIKLGKDAFDCLVVRTTFSGEDEQSGVSVKWLCPGVGLVREETEIKADQEILRVVATLAKYETAKK